MSGKSVKTPGKQPAPARDRNDQGETRATRHESTEPRLPHERDESSSSHSGNDASKDDPRLEQASRDVKNGQVDTGRAPVIDKLAREHFPSDKEEGGEPTSEAERATSATQRKTRQ